jgi:hypothetical protein
MDTQNRVLQIGKRMSPRMGESAPLSGVQSVEFGSTQPVERRGEYDSGQQVAEAGVTEYTGTVEFLTSERNDIFRELMGKTANTLADVSLEGFGRPPFVLNVWDRLKSKFTASAFADLPLYNTFPWSTQLAQAATTRLEFQPSIFVMAPLHAVGFDKFTPNGTDVTFNLTRTAKQLSHVFGQKHIMDAITVTTESNGSKTFASILSTLASTTTTSATFSTAPASAVSLYIYYLYTSVAENSGYAGSTL